MTVLAGRRRIGKIILIEEFGKGIWNLLFNPGTTGSVEKACNIIENYYIKK